MNKALHRVDNSAETGEIVGFLLIRVFGVKTHASNCLNTDSSRNESEISCRFSSYTTLNHECQSATCFKLASQTTENVLYSTYDISIVS